MGSYISLEVKGSNKFSTHMAGEAASWWSVEKYPKKQVDHLKKKQGI
jgi:hypothetical protein